MSQPWYVSDFDCHYCDVASLSCANQTEAGSRMLVHAFLLCVAAMQDQRLLLIFPEYAAPITQLRGPDDTFAVAGKLDYLLVLLSEDQERRAAVSALHFGFGVVCSHHAGSHPFQDSPQEPA